MTRPFRFGVQGRGTPTGEEWTAFARRAEALRYDVLLLPDHFPYGYSVMPALAAAGAVTGRIRLAPFVVSNDFRHPALLAKDAATIDRLSNAERRITSNSGPFFLSDGERDALDYLDRSQTPGSVLAPAAMAQLIPAETGRHTSVGHLTWTPDYLRRQLFTGLLFRGEASDRAARTLVSHSGSRFLFSGCDGSTDLTGVLRPLLASVRHFDCATVYELKPTALQVR